MERVRESQMSSYRPTGRDKALGCCSEGGIKEARMRWNNGWREGLYGGKQGW
jgi:hypothetical protein